MIKEYEEKSKEVRIDDLSRNDWATDDDMIIVRQIVGAAEILRKGHWGYMRRCESPLQKIPKHGSSGYHMLKAYVRAMLPYAIVNGVITNREYKPLGVAEYSPWVNYDSYPTCKTNLIHPDVDDRGYYFFYHDGCSPWNKMQYLDDYLYKIDVFIELLTAHIIRLKGEN